MLDWKALTINIKTFDNHIVSQYFYLHFEQYYGAPHIKYGQKKKKKDVVATNLQFVPSFG